MVQQQSLATAVFHWLSERLRDVAQWPINLIRDFPLRLSRLAHTLWQGIKGVLLVWPALFAAAQAGQTGPAAERMGGWLHRLLTQIFDLFGGPEIFQFVMHTITRTTPLTGEEIAIISSVLGPNALRYEDVRVAEGGLFDFIFKLNGNLAFATWHTVNMPRQGHHTRTNRAILVHELTHVYQYEQVGTRYLGEAIYMLIKTKRDCYNYGLANGLQMACDAGRTYRDFNREQQAQITQDYFTLRERGADVSAYETFIVQAQTGII
ncbi:MAG: DUF4157 domain-containing protein [Chloroflexota bacterium]|jgi:hypothetical protein